VPSSLPADLFAHHNRHDLVAYVEVGVDFLDVVVLFEGVYEAEGLPRGAGVEVDAVLGLHRDLGVLVRDARIIERPGTARQTLRLIDALEENDDVQEVYANFDISDEVMSVVVGEEVGR